MLALVLVLGAGCARGDRVTPVPGAGARCWLWGFLVQMRAFETGCRCRGLVLAVVLG